MSDGFSVDIQVGNQHFKDLDSAINTIAKSLLEAPDRAAKQINNELRTFLQRVATRLAEKHSANWNGQLVNPGNTLQSRTGEGMKSIKDSVSVSGATIDSLKASISTGNMTIHETGGTITARTGKYLTIPLPAACDSRGVPIYADAMMWKNTFVQRSRRGNLIIFQRNGKSITPLYLLKPSVRIKARLGLQDQIMGDLPYFTERAIDALSKAFNA